MIVETEAYSQEEKACHGNKKQTKSNQTLFGKPGSLYVYKSYGIHHCLNVVTHKNNYASGVLIRSVHISNEHEKAASGPGLVTKKFEIDMQFNSLNINKNNLICIKKPLIKINKKDLLQTTRVGISKSIDLKWRWYLKNSRSVSKREKGDRNPSKKESYFTLEKKNQ